MPIYTLVSLRIPGPFAGAPGRDQGRRDATLRAMLHGDPGPAMTLGLYHASAEVEADSLEDLFRKTNHVDGNWRENPGVRRAIRRPRSTTVGDLAVELGDGAGNGATGATVHACQVLGWGRVEDERVAARAREIAAAFLSAPRADARSARGAG